MREGHMQAVIISHPYRLTRKVVNLKEGGKPITKNKVSMSNITLFNAQGVDSWKTPEEFPTKPHPNNSSRVYSYFRDKKFRCITVSVIRKKGVKLSQESVSTVYSNFSKSQCIVISVRVSR